MGRWIQGRRHELLDIIVITICGVICGGQLGGDQRQARLPPRHGHPTIPLGGCSAGWMTRDACFMTWVRSGGRVEGEVVA